MLLPAPGLDRSEVVSREQIATLELTASQLSELSLSGQQGSFLSREQKEKLSLGLGKVAKVELLEEG